MMGLPFISSRRHRRILAEQQASRREYGAEILRLDGELRQERARLEICREVSLAYYEQRENAAKAVRRLRSLRIRLVRFALSAHRERRHLRRHAVELEGKLHVTLETVARLQRQLDAERARGGFPIEFDAPG